MMEEKDREISRLMDDNKDLHQSLESRPPVGSLFLKFNFLTLFLPKCVILCSDVLVFNLRLIITIIIAKVDMHYCWIYSVITRMHSGVLTYPVLHTIRDA